MNRLGVTLSVRRKITLLDKCAERNEQMLLIWSDLKSTDLKSGEIPHLCGDNFDIRVVPKYVSAANPILDWHFYASHVHFSRISAQIKKMDTKPKEPPDKVTHHQVLLTDSEKDSVLSTYRILLSRVMKKNFKAFQYIGSIYPTHVPHKYSKEMQKNRLRTLPMIFKDEKKTENCVADSWRNNGDASRILQGR